MLNLAADYDECLGASHDCHSNATCVNTDGSFECECNSMFSGDGRNCTSKLGHVLFVLSAMFNSELMVYELGSGQNASLLNFTLDRIVYASSKTVARIAA